MQISKNKWILLHSLLAFGIAALLAVSLITSDNYKKECKENFKKENIDVFGLTNFKLSEIMSKIK
ncbi:MAG: hypothetical protein ACR2FN_12315 [Chitinophagaceae bacterium]